MFLTEGDVLGHCQVGREIEFLVNHRHTRTLGRDGIPGTVFFPIEPHGSRIGRMNPTQNLQQGALAGPILPDQRLSLARPQRQAHLPQRLSRTESFLDSVEFES
jgi:hypothetical protein